MVTPGLYVHSKSNQRYRVLCTAWWLGPPPTNPDVKCSVASTGIRVAVGVQQIRNSIEFLVAKWSGNEPCAFGNLCVVYVAIYDEGRVSVRTVAEFEEIVQLGGVHVPRFVRLGD